MKYLFLDFDRTLFDTELFYTSLELKYVLGIQRFPKGVDFSKFIYPDVIPLLNLLKKLGFTICLVTFGERAVQEYKFQASGLVPYFKDMFYVEQGSKAAAIKRYLDSAVSCEKIIFVDDMVRHLEAFSQLIPSGIPIRIRRIGAKGSDISDNRFVSVKTLVHLEAILVG